MEAGEKGQNVPEVKIVKKGSLTQFITPSYDDSVTGIQIDTIKESRDYLDKTTLIETAPSGNRRITESDKWKTEEVHDEGIKHFWVEKPLGNSGVHQVIEMIGDDETHMLWIELAATTGVEDRPPPFSVHYNNGKWSLITLSISGDPNKPREKVIDENEEHDLDYDLKTLAGIFSADEDRSKKLFSLPSDIELQEVQEIIKSDELIRSEQEKFAKRAIDIISGSMDPATIGNLVKAVVNNAILGYKDFINILREEGYQFDESSKFTSSEFIYEYFHKEVIKVLKRYENLINSPTNYEIEYSPSDDPKMLVRKITTPEYKFDSHGFLEYDGSIIHHLDQVPLNETHIFDGESFQISSGDNISVDYITRMGRKHKVTLNASINEEEAASVISDPDHGKWQRALDLIPLHYSPAMQ